MNYNILENIQYCQEFVEAIITLIYYSHAVPAMVALLIGFFVYFKNRQLLLGRILLALSIVFSIWVSLNLVIWTNYDKGGVIMFAWAPIELFSILLFFIAFYFVYVFIEGKDISLKWKFLSVVLISPIIIFAPTIFNLEGYDIQECIAIEGGLYIYYVGALKIFLASLTTLFALYKLFINKKKRLQIALLTLGIGIFLYSRLIAGYISEQTFDYRYELYGLFGMIVFVGILAYLIVKYQEFNIKLIAAQALVTTLVMLVGAQFFFVRNPINIVLTAVTLLLVLFFGYFLVKSAKREVEQREKIEKLAKELKIANKSQEELLRFITHQIKGFLTKSRNIFAEMMEGTFGPISGDIKNIAEQGLKINTDGVNTVQTILNAANIRTGKLSYNMAPIDLRDIIQKSFEKNRKSAESKGLNFVLNIGESSEYKIKGDENQLSEAFSNLIDNSIKYTPKGEVKVSLIKSDNKIRFSVKDTGIGIAPEDKSKLFTEGGRAKNALEVNVDSTGFGLYIVKNIIEAHNGRVWVESEGEGKGSEFIVEVPTSA